MKKLSKLFAIAGFGFLVVSCNTKIENHTGNADSTSVRDTVYIKEKVKFVSNNSTVGEAEPIRTKTYSNSGTGMSNTGSAKTSERKRKMNATTKGALIGAGTGAVSGAIIDKKHRGRGAVVGGILGAGAGAVTGSVIDKKNGN